MRATLTDLDKALHLADAADAISKKHYLNVDLHIDTKPDKTPVTEADLAVDSALQKIVTEEYGDAYLSEEGEQAHRAGRQWIVDPIDGTKNFMRGMPVWATLISIQDDSGTLAAVVSAPALGRRWWAERGNGAFTQDVDGTTRQIHVSKISTVADASLLFSSIFRWDETPTGSAAVLKLLKSAWRDRSPGDFFGYTLVAEGAADACFEPSPKEWDIAAPGFIITEAGGAVWNSATPDTPAGESRIVIASNGLLHEPLLHALVV
ncbi:MAG TPA: inositol monophosphatase family protein [Candidatus Saccharimonadales bacterium]|jgi:histidinol-phosphatase|nr:inositol monophosphatase family protein [Candidatus Saccharimonadales bacterium]